MRWTHSITQWRKVQNGEKWRKVGVKGGRDGHTAHTQCTVEEGRKLTKSDLEIQFGARCSWYSYSRSIVPVKDVENCSHSNLDALNRDTFTVVQ